MAPIITEIIGMAITIEMTKDGMIIGDGMTIDITTIDTIIIATTMIAPEGRIKADLMGAGDVLTIEETFLLRLEEMDLE